MCGTALGTTGFVTCELCATPHHQDCWEYWGRCAIYACTGLRRAGLPAPAAAHEVLRVFDDDALPAGLPAGGYLDPFVTERVIYYEPRGAHPELAVGEVAVQVPAECVPLVGDDLSMLPDGFQKDEDEIPRRFRAWLRRGRAAWVVRLADGTMAFEVAPKTGSWFPGGGRVRIHRTPTRLDLMRTWIDAGRPDGLLSLVCRLALAWGGTNRFDISPDLPVPRAGEPRAPFLAQLVRLRAVGRAIGALLGLPLHERFGGADRAT